jgi:phosphohistidine phosphatase SixA
MKIILIRHGEKEKKEFKEDKEKGLTERGKKQVLYLADYLKKFNVSEIYSSNLIRAKETAEIISKKINIPIKASFEELNEYESKHFKNYFLRIFSLRLKKLKKLLDRLSEEKEKDKTIVIVSHGLTNRLIIAYLLRIKISKSLIRIRQYNACINILFWDKKHKNWCTSTINNIEHIPKKLRNMEE